MNIESAILSVVFNVDNWAKGPIINTIQKKYPNVKDEKNIPYSDKCPACLLDIHYQEKKPAEKRPCIVNIHGGGLIIGDKSNSTNYCYQIAGESNVIVFNINYGMPGKDLPFIFNKVDPKSTHDDSYIFPLQIRTHMDALKYVEAHADEYGIDLDNVFVAGDSAGSQMTSMVCGCFCSDEYANALGVEKPGFAPKGYIMNCGLYNMNVYKYIPIGRAMMVKFMGTKAPHKTEMWKYHNAMPFINEKAKNVLVVKGRIDVMTIFQSDWMVKRLKKVNVNTEFYVGKNIPNSFHDFLLLAPTKEAKKCLAYTVDWVNRTSQK